MSDPFSKPGAHDPRPLSRLPIISVRAGSAEERRIFLQTLLPGLTGHGLRTAVVSHGVAPDLEAPAALLAGSAPCVEGPQAVATAGEVVIFSCRGCESAPAMGWLADLSRFFDLVLVFEGDGGVVAGAGAKQMVAADWHRAADGAVRVVLGTLRQRLDARPVWACILIGGRSSRMGRPKHLLVDTAGRTWLERCVAVIEPRVAGVALAGKGEVPECLAALRRLPDIPGLGGPLSGILAAMRWLPDVTWLLLACDMPLVSGDAVDWMLAQGKVGQWAAVPRLQGRERVEPLFARYDLQCGPLFEEMRAVGTGAIHRVTAYVKVRVVEVPEQLREAWQNVNTPEELHRLSP